MTTPNFAERHFVATVLLLAMMGAAWVAEVVEAEHFEEVL